MDLRIFGNLFCLEKKTYLSSYFKPRYSIGSIENNIQNLERWGFHEIIISIKDSKDEISFERYCSIISNMKIFTPLLLIGGVNSLKRVEIAMQSGFDRLGFCSSIFTNYKVDFINELASYIGMQAIVIQLVIKSFNTKYIELYKPSSQETLIFKYESLVSLINSINASDVILTDFFSDGEREKFRSKILSLKFLSKINKNIICGYSYFNSNKKKYPNQLSGLIIGDSVYTKESFLGNYAIL